MYLAPLRGVELHAWLNAYRAVRQTGAIPHSPTNEAFQIPEWIITSGSYRLWNPVLAQAREVVFSAFCLKRACLTSQQISMAMLIISLERIFAESILKEMG